MANQPDWYQIARDYLAVERESLSRNRPPAIAALVEWKGQTYLGTVQEVAPEYSREIVLLSKTSKPIPEDLRKAIVELDKDRLRLTAESVLNLEERLQALRRIGNRLQPMTADQMAYAERHLTSILEVNTGTIITHGQSQRYMNTKDMGPRRN